MSRGKTRSTVAPHDTETATRRTPVTLGLERGPEPGDESVPPHSRAEPGLLEGLPGPLAAVRSHPAVAVVPIVLLVAAAVAAGLLRTPTYSAITRLQVGQVGAAAQGLGGFADSTKLLAATYSRAVDAPEVVVPVAKALRLTSSDVRARVSASPIVNTNVLELRAVGSSERAATNLANDVGQQLAHYARSLQDTAGDVRQLRVQYERAALAQRAAERELARARAARAAEQSSKADDAVARASARRVAATIRSQEFVRLYRAAVAGTGRDPAAGRVQVLEPATTAANDRRSKLEILVFTAFVAGAGLGLAAAVWRASRRRR